MTITTTRFVNGTIEGAINQVLRQRSITYNFDIKILTNNGHYS